MNATATSAYGKVLEVRISNRGQVVTTTGVFLGEREGMEMLGWEFTN